MVKSKDGILVLGVGNTLLSDEAIGVRVIEALHKLDACEQLGIETMDGGTLGLSLLVDMEDAGALVVVDATQLGDDPGTVKTFTGTAMDAFLHQRGRSPHDIGLDDLMDALRLRESLPERRALVGIQPEKLTIGENLTPAVAAAVPRAVEALLALARDWRNGR